MVNRCGRSTTLGISLLFMSILSVALPSTGSLWAAQEKDSSGGFTIHVDKNCREAFVLYLKKDFIGALAKWRIAADKGSESAMLNIEQLYRDGEGVKQDSVEAMKWYRKAADGNQATAMLYVGALYRHGMGVKQDTVEAIRWFRKAAKLGSTRAARQIEELNSLRPKK